MTMNEAVANWARTRGYIVKEYFGGVTGSYLNQCSNCEAGFIGYKYDCWCGQCESSKNKSIKAELELFAENLKDMGEELKVHELDAAKHVWIAEDNLYRAIEELNTDS